MRFELFSLTLNLLELIVIALKALDVLIEALLGLIYRLLLVIDEFSSLSFNLDCRFPSLKEPSLFYAFSFCKSSLREFAKSTQAGL